MSLGEVLLTAGIAVLVIPPSKWPIAAFHLFKLYNRIKQYQQIAFDYWQTLANQHQLQLNQKKAQAADTPHEPS